jgi:hypothetical protein
MSAMKFGRVLLLVCLFAQPLHAAELAPLPLLAQSTGGQRFPDVIQVKVAPAGAGVFNFDVTVSSPYDTPERYADGFRVTTLPGEVLGVRTLWHDHQDEQPFTRDLYGVKIPPSVKVVVVQARDQKYGYGGRLVQVRLPER